jgi:Ras homolog gene family, member A
MAKRIGAIQFLECSARTGEGVREVFQAATHEALLYGRKGTPGPSRLAFVTQLFNRGSKSKATPEAGASQQSIESPLFASKIFANKAKPELDLFVSDSTAPAVMNTFRILIIGKTGCGKTTILSKVRSPFATFRVLA